MELTRASGVLLHPTSLPGRGVGTVGAAAHRFVDWLADAGQSYWQVLPLVATDEGGSPYNGLSALAGNSLLIDPDELVGYGLLEAKEVEEMPVAAGAVDFLHVTRWKERLLERAHRALRRGAAPALEEELARYRAHHADWLGDYALFRALRAHFGYAPWSEWEPEVRNREPRALERWRRELEEEVGLHEFQQFLFDRQWAALREHAHRRGVRIIGDIPIFVAHNSADVWAHRELFQLDETGAPEVVAGVPPDYFSETGQRWGNPLYDWERMRERGYRWWVERFRRTLEWVDLVRIDHFRGFEAYWEIPASEPTALHGRWRPGPGTDFFHGVERELPNLPVIAEDLGLITPEVEALRDTLGFPGMRVLQFAFDGDPHNPHLPANYPEKSVVYTGTHDNDTSVGWWVQASELERDRVRRVLGGEPREVHWAFVELLFHSPAMLAVVPLQDLLGLGTDARMNTPGTTESNWSWRVRESELSEAIQRHLLDLTHRSQRQPRGRRGAGSDSNP